MGSFCFPTKVLYKMALCSFCVCFLYKGVVVCYVHVAASLDDRASPRDRMP